MIFLQRNYIAKIGGKTYIHKTRNILKTVLEDTTCKQLSWTGHKGSMSIKDLEFASIIIGNLSFIRILVLLY